MKKFKRPVKIVEAEQYFPYAKIDVDGFENIMQEVLDKETMEKFVVVTSAKIVIPESEDIILNPGDWVIKNQNGNIQKMCNKDFMDNYTEEDS